MIYEPSLLTALAGLRLHALHLCTAQQPCRCNPCYARVVDAPAVSHVASVVATGWLLCRHLYEEGSEASAPSKAAADSADGGTSCARDEDTALPFTATNGTAGRPGRSPQPPPVEVELAVGAPGRPPAVGPAANGTASLVARRVSGPDAAAEQLAHVQVGGLVLPFPQAVQWLLCVSLWHCEALRAQLRLKSKGVIATKPEQWMSASRCA